MTKDQVCHPPVHWGLDKRHITEKMKKQVAAAYGVPWATRSRYEFDHRVPRALSGDDKFENLWPEPLWEAKHLKDPLEVKLWRMVCAGEIELKAAQAAFLADWRVSYRRFVGELPKAVK